LVSTISASSPSELVVSSLSSSPPNSAGELNIPNRLLLSSFWVAVSSYSIT
jgi:hypothetical protein